jgi:acyl-CoA thioesterase-1
MAVMKSSVLFLKILLCASILFAPSARAGESTILVMGDSLSAAYGIPVESGWVALLQKELAGRRKDYRVANASISGETTAGGLRRLPEQLRAHRPAIVILELGANDGLRGTPVASMEANLAGMIRQSRETGAKVLLIGMQLPPNYGIEYTSGFRKAYGRLSRRFHAPLVDFLLEGMRPEEFQADNLHPVASAEPKLLNNVMPKLIPLL